MTKNNKRNRQYTNKFKKRKFCSLECSRKYTSKTKTKINYCTQCDIKIGKKSATCRTCFNIANNSINERTLGSFIMGEKYLSSKCQSIRKDARMKMKKWFPVNDRRCKFCNHDEFKEVLEVHHLKGILQFDDNVKIKDINSKENMIWICPSHHAMLEKGLMT